MDVWVDESSTAERVVLNVGEPVHVRSPYRATTPVNSGLHVIVEFDVRDPTGPPRLIGAGVRNPAEGIVAGDLRRHAWTRWIRVAQARANMEHLQTIAAGEEFNRVLERARHQLNPGPPKRPGRHGHPDSHYPEIARRYIDLTFDGSRSPVKTIAIEKHVSDNTARGWIKECRRRGLLGPGLAGRAG